MRNNTYCLVVVFMRQHDEDDDILRDRAEEITPLNLVRLFAREMQEAMDSVGEPAGHFQVAEYIEGESVWNSAIEIARKFE